VSVYTLRGADQILLAYALHARDSYSGIARQLNRTEFEPPFGRKWTEAAVAHEYGRLIAAKVLETKP
jgi:hypothetical protein